MENYIEYLKEGSGIHIKKKNRGKFTDYCGGKVTEECIARGKNSPSATIRKRATFAANARKWNHSKGGIIKAEDGTVIPYINLGETYSKEAEKKKEQNYRDRIRNIMNRGNVEIIDAESPEGEAEELIVKPDQDRSWAEQFRLQIPSEKTTQNGEYIKTESRSDRNNNPLNIRFTSIPWEGKITKGKSDNDFEEFETRDYGWRAAYRNINTKIVRDKLNTIRKLINVWAPKNENNTEQYIQHVTELTGIDPDETINPNDINTIPKIAAAMAAIEAGKQEVDLDDALRGFKFYLS